MFAKRENFLEIMSCGRRFTTKYEWTQARFLSGGISKMLFSGIVTHTLAEIQAGSSDVLAAYINVSHLINYWLFFGAYLVKRFILESYLCNIVFVKN